MPSIKRKQNAKSKGKAYMAASAKRRAAQQIISKASNKRRMLAAPVSVVNVRTAGFIGLEKKFLDSTLASTALTAPTDASGAEHDPATVNCLNAIAQGDGESNRDGRRCTLHSITISGIAAIPNGTGSTGFHPTQVTVALVLDKQTNGAQLSSENVFVQPSASGVFNPCMFRNLQYQDRFEVLSVRQIDMGQQPLTHNGTNVLHNGVYKRFHMFKDLKDLPCTFSGTTANVSNITDNSLHLIAYCNTTTANPTIGYNCRVRFSG